MNIRLKNVARFPVLFFNLAIGRKDLRILDLYLISGLEFSKIIFLVVYGLSYCFSIPDLNAQVPRAGLSGLVVAENSREPLPGANIRLTPGMRGTATDANGRFRLYPLAPGRYQIAINFIGYKTYQDSLVLMPGTSRYLHITLAEEPLKGQEITVTAAEYDQTQHVRLSQKVITAPELRQGVPVGEPDLLRTLTLQPGMAAMNDYNTRFYVRGGRGNENQVLVDDVTIHNPYHALGFFSIFEIDAIKMVEVFRGVAPSRYCERLSSVTNVILRDGNAQQIAGSGMLSLITSKLLLEGPCWRFQPDQKRKWTWMLSGRRTYFDLVAPIPFSFYDLSAKTVYDSGEKTRLVLHSFYGVDRINSSLADGFAGMLWKNRVIGLNWQQFISPRLTWQNRISYSDFNTSSGQIGTNPTPAFYETNQLNGIRELTGNSEWRLNPFQHWQLTLGYAFSRFNMDQNLSTFYDRYYRGSWRNYDQHKGYFALEGNWQEVWIFELGGVGLHLPTNAVHKFAPRLGIKYRLNDRWQLKGGLGRHYQPLMTINDDFDPLVLFDAWIPSPTNRPIARADHYGLGLNVNLGKSLQAEGEIYYRRHTGLTLFNRQQREGEPFFLDGWAEAWGAEVELNLDYRRWFGFVNISCGQATSHFFLRNQPMRHLNDFRWYTFPSAGDIRLAMNLALTLRTSGKWEYNLACLFQTGRPYTTFLGQINTLIETPNGNFAPLYRDIFEYFHAVLAFYSEPNAYRFPFYQRLDVRIARNFRWGKVKGNLFCQIYNLIYRKNTAFHFAVISVGEKERALGLPILPTLGVAFQF